MVSLLTHLGNLGNGAAARLVGIGFMPNNRSQHQLPHREPDSSGLEAATAGLRFEFPPWRSRLIVALLVMGLTAYVSGRLVENAGSDVAVGLTAVITTVVAFAYNVHLRLLCVVMLSTRPMVIILTLIQNDVLEIIAPSRPREGFYTLAHTLVTLAVVTLDATKTRSRQLKVRRSSGR